MQINYPSDAERSASRRRPKDKTNNAAVLAIGGLVIVAGLGLAAWYFFTREPEAPAAETLVAATGTASVTVLDRQPYAANDGFAQCNSRTFDISTKEAQAKRSLCYYAVMVIFDTADICSLPQIDAAAQPLCAEAQKLFKKYQSEQGRQPGASGTATAPTVVQTPGEGVTIVMPQSGTGSNSNASGNATGTSNTNTRTNTNGTGNTNGGGTGNANGNTNANTNVNASTNTNTNSNTSTGTGGTGNSNTNGNANDNTNQTITESVPCYDEQGQVLLLQHTNICN